MISRRLGVSGVPHFRVSDLVLAIPRLADRRRLQQLARAIQFLPAGHNRIEQPPLQSMRGIHDGAGQQHLQRRLRTHQPRQPLRPTGTGIDTQIDFRHAQPGSGGRDAVMTGQGELERAADDIAGHGGDHRLGRILDFLERFLKDARHPDRIVRRRQLLKQVHVRAGAEMIRAARNDDAPHVRVRVGLPNRRAQLVQHPEGQRIQGRRVQPQQAHAVGNLVI